jgi:hypothetical protein
MRAVAVTGETLRLCLADVTAELEPAVTALGFTRRGALFVRAFATVDEQVAARFEACAEAMVEQAAGRAPAPWENALELLIERAGGREWVLAGSAAHAVRGVDIEPHDIDVVASSSDCDAIGEALHDVLVEPVGDGGWLGARWWRAFAGARIECVGDPCDRSFADVGETVVWRGHPLRLSAHARGKPA